MSRATRRRSWSMALAVVAGAVVAGPGAVEAQEGTAAPSKTLVVTDDSIIRQQHRGGPVVVNDIITYVLHDNAQKKHSFNFSEVSPRDYELDPADPNKRSFTITFDKVGKFYYRCKVNGLSGFVKVEERVATTEPSTTSSTVRPTTTTTLRQAPSTSTTTARPTVTAPPSTVPQGVVPAGVKPTTTSTTPPGVPTTPADEVGAADAETDEVAFQEASHQEEDRRRGTTMLIIAIGLAAALLGAGGWGWYHRPSRYLSA
jgi:hypothetical protein